MNMNSPRPKPVAEINLEEFERRLRASVAPQAGVEDPLAELTRLVDTIGLERSPSERALDYGRSPRPAPPPAPAVAAACAAACPSGGAARRAAAPTPAASSSARAGAASIRRFPAVVRRAGAAAAACATWSRCCGLRSTPKISKRLPSSRDRRSRRPRPPRPPRRGRKRRCSTPAPRARNWGLKVGGLLAAAAVMAGAVVVFKVGGHSHAGPPPLILASTAPTKVAPPSDDTVRTANESGSLLTHDTAQATPTPPKLVDTPEAPVDLSARVLRPRRTRAATLRRSPRPTKRRLWRPRRPRRPRCRRSAPIRAASRRSPCGPMAR